MRTAAQARLIGYLTSGKPVKMFGDGEVVTCHGFKASLRTVRSFIESGILEPIPKKKGMWRLTEQGKRWYLMPGQQSEDE